MKSITDILNNRVILVDVLAILFGISSWVTIDGVWVETPIMTGILPEKWKLASYIVIIVQIANIGPITYSILKRKYSIRAIEGPAIHVILLIGSLACLLSVFFWDTLTEMNGEKHSLALLILTGLLAVVDTTTSVLYMPFMTIFKPKYLMSLVVGESLSGSVPSAIALIQGITADPVCVNSTRPPYKPYAKYAEPKFTVGIFYLFLFGVMLISWTAFACLYHMKRFRSERVSDADSVSEDSQLRGPTDDNTVVTRVSHKDSTFSSINGQSSDTLPGTTSTQSSTSRSTIMPLLATQALICSLTNGVLPSISSYSTAPYGFEAYHYSVTLTSIIGPLGCFLAFNISHRIIRKILPFLVSLATVCAMCLIITAATSPTPPLYDTSFGKVLIVLISMGCRNGFSFSRACISALLRRTQTSHDSLFMYGVFTQIGSTVGAVIMFFVVNYGDYFHSYKPCG